MNEKPEQLVKREKKPRQTRKEQNFQCAGVYRNPEPPPLGRKEALDQLLMVICAKLLAKDEDREQVGD